MCEQPPSERDTKAKKTFLHISQKETMGEAMSWQENTYVPWYKYNF